MVQAHIVSSATQVAEGETQAAIVVRSLGDDSNPAVELEVLHRPESVGNENCAYLFFGVPGTGSYSFMDLNQLPEGMKVCVTFEQNGVVMSQNEFNGKNGNAPQVAPPQESA